MKTLDDFITQKACEVSGMHPDEMRISKVPSESVQWWKEIAERYAAYLCQEQRKLCTEHARLSIYIKKDNKKCVTESTGLFVGFTPDREPASITIHKDSILNAPLATDKNK